MSVPIISYQINLFR